LRQDREAIVWLRGAAGLRDNEIILLNVDLRSDRLGNHPAFEEIVRSFSIRFVT
jgi:hypothetical protein